MKGALIVLILALVLATGCKTEERTTTKTVEIERTRAVQTAPDGSKTVTVTERRLDAKADTDREWQVPAVEQAGPTIGALVSGAMPSPWREVLGMLLGGLGGTSFARRREQALREQDHQDMDYALDSLPEAQRLQAKEDLAQAKKNREAARIRVRKG